MGTKMAPSFANISMAALEQSLLSSTPNKLVPLLNDIFLIWTHGEDSFQSFIPTPQLVSPSISLK